MDYISVRDASGCWKVSERWIQKLCEEGRIEGVKRFGRFLLYQDMKYIIQYCRDFVTGKKCDAGEQQCYLNRYFPYDAGTAFSTVVDRDSGSMPGYKISDHSF